MKKYTIMLSIQSSKTKTSKNVNISPSWMATGMPGRIQRCLYKRNLKEVNFSEEKQEDKNNSKDASVDYGPTEHIPGWRFDIKVVWRFDIIKMK